jgi:regulatory protein
MKTITAIKSQRRSKRRANLFLDGKFAFSLEMSLVREMNLREGQVLSDSEIESLARANVSRRCFDAALQFLSYRPRSESETRTRLRRRGFDDASIETTLARLRELGLIDDLAFAKSWVENRELFSPRSPQLLRLELRQKGIDTALGGEIALGVDEYSAAYRAAQKKARNIPFSDYRNFCGKLGSFLRRRGFSYEVTKHTLDRLWREQQLGENSEAERGCITNS